MSAQLGHGRANQPRVVLQRVDAIDQRAADEVLAPDVDADVGPLRKVRADGVRGGDTATTATARGRNGVPKG
ncbi:MAG: hypothetical protein R2708_25010 [Vicinamibacterales bacterium]